MLPANTAAREFQYSLLGEALHGSQFDVNA
jgi:hypothetical protein